MFAGPGRKMSDRVFESIQLRDAHSAGGFAIILRELAEVIYHFRKTSEGGCWMKKVYRKPALRRLGLLRRVTRTTVTLITKI